MRESLFSKSLVFIVILLFIGVAFAPSINQSVVTASQNDDLVEVTTQACGIKGYGNTTVKLTREQYQNLEQYLVDFRERLNQTTTKEEAVPIFKEAVVELNKYGLLPKGLRVKQAQELVLNNFQRNTIKSRGNSGNANIFSLIAAKINNTGILPAIFYIILVSSTLIGLLFYGLFPYFSVDLWDFVGGPLADFFFNRRNPISICSLVFPVPYGAKFSGWLIAIGVFGFKHCSGSFDAIVYGFSGLKIQLNREGEYFLLGFAPFIIMG